jgi:5-formyltetrahydrofolate cyclo-ligase
LPDDDDALKARKDALRKRARKTLEALPDELRRTAAPVVANAVWAHLRPHLKVAKGPVALFASLPVELSTTPLDERLRDAGVPRVFPRVSGDELTFHLVPDDLAGHALPRGNFRVPSPDKDWPAVPLFECAAVVVPGLAFDTAGRRLGWGRGFYDRALAPALASVTPPQLVAIAFDEQLVEEVPVGANDVRVPAVCTPALGVRETIC